MSYEDVDKVLNSGIEDGTLFNVMVALAFFNNDRSGLCNPSTKKISMAARRSQNVVRTAIQRLEELGYIETRQVPGFPRFFDLRLDRIPGRTEPLKDIKALSEGKPLSEVEPLAHSDPLSEVEGTPFHKCEGTPFRSEREPLSEVKAEKVNEKVKEKVIEKVIASVDGAHARSKPTSRAKTFDFPRPEDVDDQTWADFVTHRRTRKAAITSTAMKMLRTQAERAGISLQEAIEITIDRNWQSFRADWYANSSARDGRKPVDRSHFAHEKPMNQKDFSMSERQRKEMERLFALEAEEASRAVG